MPAATPREESSAKKQLAKAGEGRCSRRLFLCFEKAHDKNGLHVYNKIVKMDFTHIFKEADAIRQIEILAPAGGRQQLEAAVRAGADAVYLGFGRFNARRNAENFDADALAQAIAYCHGRGVKVHAAFNTLVTEEELPEAEKELAVLAASGIDALIVQDLGIAKMARECAPSLPLHASTQLTVHNRSGVKMLRELGFQRVVLARELSLEEIRSICSSTDLEVEVFIHGALCMCVSGACYLSSVLGGRSGNRGLCAQPCRLNFTTGSREYALSLKDMSHIQHLQALIEAGVTSFKIEGRMKRPEYVAAACHACRQALEGLTPDMQALKAVFSRSGFTDGYLQSQRNLAMFGTRSKEDVTAASGVLKELTGLYRQERQSVPLVMNFTLQKNAPCVLTVSDSTHTVTKSGDIPNPALTRPLQKEDIQKQLFKTGGTPFFIKEITLQAEDGLSLPLSSLNTLRRGCLEELLAQREKPVPHTVRPFAFSPGKHTPKNPSVRLRVQQYAQLKGISEPLRVILPIEEITAACLQRFPDAAAEIPPLVFPGDEPAVTAHLQALKALGLRYAMCENLGAVAMAREAGLIPLGGCGLNILNSAALAAYEALGIKDGTVSFETGERNLAHLRGAAVRGALGYGHLPLMRMRACPAKSAQGCGKCSGRPTLTDRLGIRFPMLCSNRKFTTLFNSVPLYTGDKLLRGADFFTLYFTFESAEEVRRITQAFSRGEPLSAPHTTGLYFKKLR